MAYFSTSSSQSGNLLPKSLLKQRVNEEASFLESSPLEDDYLYSDFKRLAAKDEKLRVLLQFIPHFEAQKRAKSYMKTFLHDKAEKKRRDEYEDTEDEDTKTIPVVPIAVVAFGYEKKHQSKLMKLELRSFIFKLWLRRIHLTKNEDKGRYTSLQNFERAIHNVQKVIKEYKCSLYTQNYNEVELENRLETISNKVLEEKEQASFEMTEEDSVRFQCQTSRLCALLGLELDFLDDLEETKPECRHHRKLSDWVEIFLEDSIESAATADYNSLTKKLLVSIGFDPLSTAVETMMARSFTGSTQQHIEASEWAQIFIKDEFKYNPLLSPLTSKFPFQRDLTNTWFHLPRTADEESENNEDLCHVNIMNLVTEESNICSKTRTVLSDCMPEDDKNIVLYHGTDHKSANNILIRGIHLYAGRQKRDFSCGKGFYLTKNIEDALNWAKSTTARPAVLIFSVKRKYLDKARKLNLNENKEKWLEIISCFRTAKRTAKKRKSLSSFDLIEGPLASVTRSAETPNELVFNPKPFSHQMCLISDSFAEEFEKRLHSVVFYDIS